MGESGGVLDKLDDSTKPQLEVLVGYDPTFPPKLQT